MYVHDFRNKERPFFFFLFFVSLVDIYHELNYISLNCHVKLCQIIIWFCMLKQRLQCRKIHNLFCVSNLIKKCNETKTKQ